MSQCIYSTTLSKATRKKIAWQWPIVLNDMVTAVCMVMVVDRTTGAAIHVPQPHKVTPEPNCIKSISQSAARFIIIGF